MANINKKLNQAKKEKNDEFYTLYEDIENELIYYKDLLKDKTIYCNCDTRESNFYKFFKDNFHNYKLKKLIITGIDNNKVTYDGNNEIIESISSGLFQNNINILKASDIIITNPPFTLFREYIAQLIEYNKKFLIVGNQNANKYKDIFPYIKNNKIWYGVSIHSGDIKFYIPDNYSLEATTCGYDGYNKRFIRVKGVRWFTNLDHNKKVNKLETDKSYYDNPNNYPKYDNYDAININKTKDIPMDYNGLMGVPISFLDKYNSDQFEIIDTINPKINNIAIYQRFIIKKK